VHILFLSQIIPFPPDAGPRVKTWHVLRYLIERGHQISLASFVRPEEEPFLEQVRKLGITVYPVPIQRSRLADIGYLLRSNLSGRPFLVERDDLPGMRRQVAEIMAAHAVDAIHADQITMAQFALPYRSKPAKNGGKVRLIFDAHNATWTIIERMGQNAPLPLKLPAFLETRRLKRYEGMILHLFDHTLAVTEPDRQALLAAAAVYQPGEPPITVAPIAVDTRQLAPARRQPGSRNVLTLGTLHYPPNADGVRWFAQEIFPRVRAQVPESTLTIIGKNPPSDLVQLAQAQPGVIEVTGYVPDLDAHMDRAALMVVPVRAGGGMRVRILEAFARAMPVVTTTVGLEGIEAKPGRDVLVEDDPAAFAAAVVRLLDDPAQAAQLAENGRRLAQERYDWQVVLKKMDAVYLPHNEPAEEGVHAYG
jgi:polysaccharide biosynthesis protein PslH